MQFRGVEIEFILKPGPESSSEAPMGTDALVGLEEPFRIRVTTILKRAIERGEEIFEMSGQDNRYLDFPIVGAAKIVAQEIYRLVKQDRGHLKKIIINIQGEHLLSVFKETFEGYIHHLENVLGEEPYHTVDLIIEFPQGIVLIERSNPVSYTHLLRSIKI